MHRILRQLPLLLMCIAPPTLAQDDGSMLDRIEVTGSRVTYRDLLDTPAISLTRRGDYLLQSITLINDTRDADTRRDELHRTIAGLVATAGTRYRVLHGDSYPLVLDRGNYRVEVAEDGKRPDVSRVELRLRHELGDASIDGEQIVRDLRDFARKADVVGRTEIELAGDTALGMNRPERYRYELIAAIAEDSKRIASMLGDSCRIELDGLNTRIDWERVGAIELLLYVPYTMLVTHCAASESDQRETKKGVRVTHPSQ